MILLIIGLPLIVVALFGLVALVRVVEHHLAVRRMRERMIAKGSTLDKLGNAYGMRRRPRESDRDYRARIARTVSNVEKRDDWVGR